MVTFTHIFPLLVLLARIHSEQAELLHDKPTNELLLTVMEEANKH